MCSGLAENLVPKSREMLTIFHLQFLIQVKPMDGPMNKQLSIQQMVKKQQQVLHIQIR